MPRRPPRYTPFCPAKGGGPAALCRACAPSARFARLPIDICARLVYNKRTKAKYASEVLFMKVILKQDVKGTGKKGDILDVSDGFAKNFLLKKGLAEQASAVAVNSLKLQKEAEARRRAEEERAVRELAKRMDKAQVTVSIKCGENGKVFGSVTSREIAARLADLGYDVDKKKIVLKEALKTVGEFPVEVRLMEGVSAKIVVSVVPE